MAACSRMLSILLQRLGVTSSARLNWGQTFLSSTLNLVSVKDTWFYRARTICSNSWTLSKLLSEEIVHWKWNKRTGLSWRRKTFSPQQRHPVPSSFLRVKTSPTFFFCTKEISKWNWNTHLCSRIFIYFQGEQVDSKTFFFGGGSNFTTQKSCFWWKRRRWF